MAVGLLEGAAGIGKTSLLDAAAANERDAEISMIQSAVRELFERRAARDPQLMTGAAAQAMPTLTAVGDDANCSPPVRAQGG